MKDLLERLNTKYTLSDIVHQQDNLVFLTIRKENAIDLVTYLKDYEGFSPNPLQSQKYRHSILYTQMCIQAHGRGVQYRHIAKLTALSIVGLEE